MTMPGIPFVYYGDEIGMKYIPDMPSKEGGFTRTGSRTPMQWAKGKNAGFSEANSEDLYLPVDEAGENVSDQLSDPDSLLNTMKKLISLRKNTQALSSLGEIEFLNRNYGGYPLVYKRSDAKAEYLVCLNPLDKESEIKLSVSGEVILQNKTIKIEEEKVVLAPVSYAIIKLN